MWHCTDWVSKLEAVNEDGKGETHFIIPWRQNTRKLQPKVGIARLGRVRVRDVRVSIWTAGFSVTEGIESLLSRDLV